NLNVGDNTITVVGTAQDGVTTQTYTVTVNRAAPASTVATLANLVLSQGTLTPAFASGTTIYTASVGNAVTSLTVTPTVTDANATVTVNGNTVASGNASGP
ncbi:cadherin-like beta sandwich domain-containing protein, partial [Pannonibacter sp. Pt2]